jgi:hypothetical protein
MNINQLNSIIFTSAVAASILVTAGCVSKSYDKGTMASVATDSAAAQVATVSTKVTDTLGALNALAFKPEGDLRSQFDKFNSAVKGLQVAASDLDAKVTVMQFQGQAYLDNWNNQLAAIGNEEIRSLSAQRKATVTTNLATAVYSYELTKGALQPFLLDVRDIQTYLNNDLTASGVTAIKATVAKTKADAVPLRDSIKKLRSGFSELGKSLSPVMSGGK